MSRPDSEGTYERGYIGGLFKLGYSTRGIAKEVGRYHSCIARELKRNSTSGYEAEKAQQVYALRRKLSKAKGKYTPEKEVDSRTTFGHWELDTMVSSRGKSKGCLATFVERKARLYTAIKIPDRTADPMGKAINQLYSVLPAGAFKTGTTDRGKEFACYQSIQQNLDLTLYFADPYSSWQRGSNENSNGLLREFYPKKTDLALVDEQELIHNLFLIKSRPRKCLGWKSPIQVFLHEVSHLT